jgi:chitodextrinase
MTPNPPTAGPVPATITPADLAARSGEPQSGGQDVLAPGDRVELTGEPPDYAHYALTAGDQGTEFTDSLSTVHIRWDRGCQAGIIAELVGLLRKDES